MTHSLSSKRIILSAWLGLVLGTTVGLARAACCDAGSDGRGYSQAIAFERAKQARKQIPGCEAARIETIASTGHSRYAVVCGK